MSKLQIRIFDGARKLFLLQARIHSTKSPAWQTAALALARCALASEAGMLPTFIAVVQNSVVQATDHDPVQKPSPVAYSLVRALYLEHLDHD